MPTASSYSFAVDLARITVARHRQLELPRFKVLKRELAVVLSQEAGNFVLLLIRNPSERDLDSRQRFAGTGAENDSFN